MLERYGQPTLNCSEIPGKLIPARPGAGNHSVQAAEGHRQVTTRPFTYPQPLSPIQPGRQAFGLASIC